MERMTLKADSREVGKKGLNRLRHGGMIPAILYGLGQKSQGLSLNAKELTRLLKTGGLNALFELDLGEAAKTTRTKGLVLTMLKEFQTDPVSRQILHVDLLRIDLKEEVTVSVPVQLVGKSTGVEQGGILDLVRRELEVRCLPTNIPEKIEIDVSQLNIGDSIHIDDLKLPEGISAPHEVNFNIVSVAAPRKEEPTPAEAAAVAVEPGAVPATAVKVEEPVGKAEGEKGEKPKGEKPEKPAKGKE